jgi:hypothetical protein
MCSCAYKSVSTEGFTPSRRAKTVPESGAFMPLGLALTEKQIPQITENTEKPKEQIEGVESSFAIRRQTLTPAMHSRIFA